MATFYSRDQTGSPTLTFNAATGAASHFANLKLILKACLVTGFGSQAAAGWELINEGTNFIVLRNGSHTGYVCLTNVSGYVSVYLSSTYTGMSGDVMTGDGVKSGIAASSSAPQKMDIRFAQYASANSSWCVIADNKTFVLDISAVNTATPAELLSAGGNQGSLWYVGEDSNGWFIAVGGENTAGSPGQWFSYSGLTTLRNPATGLLVGSDAILIAVPPLDNYARTYTLATSSPVVPDIETAKVIWAGGGVYAGKLRGIAIPVALCANLGAYVAYGLGATSYNARNACNPINLGDAYSWILAWKTTSSMALLMTTHPDYW